MQHVDRGRLAIIYRMDEKNDRKNTNPEDAWMRSLITDYSNIKDLTWEEVYNDFQNYQNGKDSISWKQHRNAYKYNPDTRESVRDEENDWEYTQYLAELLIEAMREDNYDTDVCDTDYADDYDENFDCSVEADD